VTGAVGLSRPDPGDFPPPTLETLPRRAQARLLQRSSPLIHEWACWARTIPRTIVTGIGPRVRRAIA
jgi:hypothetical protein